MLVRLTVFSLMVAGCSSGSGDDAADKPGPKAFARCASPDNCVLECPAGASQTTRFDTIFYCTAGETKLGPYIEFHSPHKPGVYKTGWYTDDDEDGTWKYWTESGRLAGTITLKHGSGTLVRWDRWGNKAARIELVNGKYTGPYTKWWPDGAKQAEGAWLDDKPCGEWKCWETPAGIGACPIYRRHDNCTFTPTGMTCPPCK